MSLRPHGCRRGTGGETVTRPRPGRVAISITRTGCCAAAGDPPSGTPPAPTPVWRRHYRTPARCGVLLPRDHLRPLPHVEALLQCRLSLGCQYACSNCTSALHAPCTERNALHCVRPSDGRDTGVRERPRQLPCVPVRISGVDRDNLRVEFSVVHASGTKRLVCTLAAVREAGCRCPNGKDHWFEHLCARRAARERQAACAACKAGGVRGRQRARQAGRARWVRSPLSESRPPKTGRPIPTVAPQPGVQLRLRPRRLRLRPLPGAAQPPLRASEPPCKQPPVPQRVRWLLR